MIVAVVLVIILGVVYLQDEYGLMQVWICLNAIVMTTTQGQVLNRRRHVTKRLNRYGNGKLIEKCSSMSSEKCIVVILEFGSPPMGYRDMEMRDNLDQIKGYWVDS